MVATLTVKQREANRLLAGPARNVMLRGGSRSGKTFILIRAICHRAINAPGSRHAIFRFRFNHAKISIWSDTLPKVLELCFPGLVVRFDKTDFYVEFPNGSQIWIGGLDDNERVEKILGQEYATLYFNESSQIPWGSVETAMSRLAQKCALAQEIANATGRQTLRLKAFFDCNPPSKLHWSYQLFRAGMKPGTKEAIPNPDDYVEMKINPADNADNLPAEYFDVLASMSAAKRLRFEAGEWASEVNGALWALEDRTAPDGKTMPGIDANRVNEAPEMRRIVVAVDPSGTRGDGGGDDIGIVVAGLGVDGRGYVLEDATVNMSPEGWGRRAVELYHRWEADRIVGERNYGGDMVRFTIATADKNAAFKEVVASRGKAVRAEPVSALYEQGKVSHVGVFADLEDQMCLASGTLIETDRGQVPIEEVTISDRVMTRGGFAPLKWAGCTGESSWMVEIEGAGCKIRATKSHPIFDLESGEFVPASSVNASHRLLVSPRWESTATRSLGAADGITACRPDTTGMRRESSFIGRFTRRITALFHRAATFITEMKIRVITRPTISSPYRDRRMYCNTQMVGMRDMPLIRRPDHASHAENRPHPSEPSQSTIARIGATCGHTEPVYNLSVAEGYLPEFFANGILVHNCNFTASGFVGEGSPDRADALVWAMTELMLGEKATAQMFLSKKNRPRAA